MFVSALAVAVAAMVASMNDARFLSAHEKWNATLKSASEPSGDVIISLCVGSPKLSNNLLASYPKIVMFLPPRGEVTLAPRTNHLIHTNLLSGLHQDSWAGVDHVKINSVKPTIIAAVLRLNYSVLWIDHDSVLLRPPWVRHHHRFFPQIRPATWSRAVQQPPLYCPL